MTVKLLSQSADFCLLVQSELRNAAGISIVTRGLLSRRYISHRCVGEYDWRSEQSPNIIRLVELLHFWTELRFGWFPALPVELSLEMTKIMDRGYSWVICGVTFSCYFLQMIGISAFGILYPEFIDHFSSSNAQTAIIGSLNSAVGAISGDHSINNWLINQ